MTSDPNSILASAATDKSRDSVNSNSGSGAAQPLEPALFIVSTPIGNLRDITLRALDVLRQADEVLAEDTRVARKLLDTYDIRTKITPYHDHNGSQRRPQILAQLAAGQSIALISDAGTPLISDPGWKLARDVIESGHRIIPLPGASAVLAGLVTSGLPTDRFMFCGFLPPRSAARIKTAKSLSGVPASLIFYESGARLATCLQDLVVALGGDRDAAIGRELTKLFEETRRGSLANLAATYQELPTPKGEIVLMLGPPANGEPSNDDIANALRGAMKDKSVKAAVAEVSETLGLPRRQVYQHALTLKNGAK